MASCSRRAASGTRRSASLPTIYAHFPKAHGQNDHLINVEGTADTLTRLGESIRGLRSQLGMVEEFQPYDRFLHYRSLRGPNVPGEPKLAEAFFRELNLLTPTG